MNFLNFRFDTIATQSIINLCRYGSKSYASVVLGDYEVTFFFLEKRRVQPFVHLSIVFW